MSRSGGSYTIRSMLRYMYFQTLTTCGNPVLRTLVTVKRGGAVQYLRRTTYTLSLLHGKGNLCVLRFSGHRRSSGVTTYGRRGGGRGQLFEPYAFA